MARRFGSTPFCEVLPHNLAQDSTVRNAADALDGILAKSALALPELLIYARLAESPLSQLLPPLERIAILAGGLTAIPEPLLDLLAWQFHVDGYEAAVTYADKRRLVDRSILMHRRKGTPWAVAEALRSLGYEDARIFEGGGICHYDGEINYSGNETYAAGNRWALFDVEIDLGDGMGISAASVLRLRTAIEAWKNARSHLRAIRWKATVSDSLDFDELLAVLAVKPTFWDFRPWGFPCYDGSINYGNGLFRRYEGRLRYDGGHSHSFWEPHGHCYSNLLDPLKMGGFMRLSSIVRPSLYYDGFIPHNGGAMYGHTDAPALEASRVTVAAKPVVEKVEVSESVETSIQPKALEWMFRCHNGSLTYGPHVMNGAFNYDASHNHDSGIFLSHAGRASYGGAWRYDRWLRNGPLYNEVHDRASFGGSLRLSDTLRHVPRHSGHLFYGGDFCHAPLDVPAVDSAQISVSQKLVDVAAPDELEAAKIRAGIHDEIDRACFDGSISYGQRRVNIHSGTFAYDGSHCSGFYGGKPFFRSLIHDGAGQYDGLARHHVYGWQSGRHAPVWFYRSLADSCHSSVAVKFSDSVSCALEDEIRVAVVPRLVEDMRPHERCSASVACRGFDQLGASHDGSISYGQKRMGVYGGSRLYAGDIRSGCFGGMECYSKSLHGGQGKYDGALRHSLWPDALYSYRALSDFCDAELSDGLADSFGLEDGLCLSVTRYAFSNGAHNYNSNQTYSGKELA